MGERKEVFVFFISFVLFFKLGSILLVGALVEENSFLLGVFLKSFEIFEYFCYFC
jgi:hypothetical protein